MSQDTKTPHSAEYFGPERDYWWNGDFLRMIAERWSLRTVSSALDVGAGVGHWGRVLVPHLASNATVVGIDPELEWVQRATKVADEFGLSRRMTYLHGGAEAIPFQDGRFDLVTCQTVLMHVRDAKAALREMVRVVRPGGRLLVVEPNNLAASLVFGSTHFESSIDLKVALVRLQATCEKGKAVLGEGNDSIGDVVPGMLLELGVESIDVALSDKAEPLLPPYQTPSADAWRRQILDWAERKIWLWEKQRALRYFIAGGGQSGDFEALWKLGLSLLDSIASDIARNRYHTAGGGITYLVTGLRPKQ